MIPSDDFTPHGYLDNPYHSWKLNPSGMLRSLPPLGMGWHVPNLGSYVLNQFQYTAHLTIGLNINDLVLITPEDFRRHKCTINSQLHTKTHFEYTCIRIIRIPVVSTVNQIPGQQRSCRPGSVRRASVPSRFQHVISPGVAPQVNETGTSPDGSSNSPTTLHVLANGPGLDRWGCPPQASPIRVCPDGACAAISAAWGCLRWRFRLALPMPLLIERVVHIFCCIVIGIGFIVTARTSKHLSPLCFHPCAASV
jgi:hypothetical protein